MKKLPLVVTPPDSLSGIELGLSIPPRLYELRCSVQAMNPERQTFAEMTQTYLLDWDRRRTARRRLTSGKRVHVSIAKPQCRHG